MKNKKDVSHKKNNKYEIRNKANEKTNKSKEDKSNISNFEKRRNYNVSKV